MWEYPSLYVCFNRLSPSIITLFFVSSDKFEQNGNSNNTYIFVASISSVLVLVLGVYPDLILSTIDNVISGL